MKLKTKDIIDKLIVLSIIIVCLSIFLPPFFKSISISLLAIAVLGAFFSKAYSLKPSVNKESLLLIAFFFLHIIGVFYSSDKNSALFDLQIKLSLIILPLLFIFIPKQFLSKDKLWTYFLAIIIGLVLTIFYCFISGVVRSISNSLPLVGEIIYTKLGAKFHPSYLSLFASVGLVLTYKIPLNQFLKAPNQAKLIKIFTIALISFFLVMLNSRSGLLILIIAYLWILIDLFFVEKKRISALITLFVLIVCGFFILNSNFLSMRYRNAIENIAQEKNINHESNSMSQRSFIYSNSWTLVSKNLVFGVGTGDVKSTFESLYEKENVRFSSYLNAHNQYLQTTIALGMVGLLVLVLVFLFPMIRMLKQKQYFLLIIFLLIGFSYLFESMLERNMGTYFFALIYVLSNSYLSTQKPKLD
ncbi:MAG: O-antigen ligase family protein [Bacteroidales bacterium]|jgi:O-antigen ligase|nr:O-antigen ligase family protein [Bacteroidales bacterium]MDD4703538.1 O-antigen ligase family protein [Bacteroidales bacterium]MDX9798073.1 O-antigen ligase family protein [Bacteroidales bacterium]